ncbi:MAG TPA: hypothetical protein DCZ94_20960 [Lentisphaeria bacterium]|nr:MAG: hypothetical protein A2X48_23165 [Lentisphaerae bacterium GWF2_49_21]HBC89417.1 hypothetical protein [Lentisphaeria bacterium]
MKTEKKQKWYQVQSVDRAIEILNRVAMFPQGIGVRELARQVKLKTPTAYALARTLESKNYLEFDQAEKKYKLGISAIILGFGTGTTWFSRIGMIVDEKVRKLVAEAGESAVVYGLFGNLIVSLNAVNADNEIGVNHKSGHFMQYPHGTASGLVLIANANKDFIDYYVKSGLSKTKDEISPEELMKKLESVRKDGYAEMNNYRNSGVYAVAFPIKGFLGKNDLSLAVAMPLVRFSAAKRKSFLVMVGKYATEISKELEKYSFMSSNPKAKAGK